MSSRSNKSAKPEMKKGTKKHFRKPKNDMMSRVDRMQTGKKNR